jgi:hypothetical protein
MPSLYFKLLKVIESPDPTVDAVAELIESDLAISTQLIRVVNSSYYGQERHISNLREAIQVLGFSTIKSLVLAIQAFAQMDGVKPVYFSIEKVWRHGLAVGQWAREIARLESNDTVLAEQAYTAGLLHDIGKIVFVANLNADYDAALKRAHEHHISPVLAEAAILAHPTRRLLLTDRALGLAARSLSHRVSPRSGRFCDEEFSPLTAVYLANLFKNLQICNGHAPGPHPIALGYLSRVGLAIGWISGKPLPCPACGAPSGQRQPRRKSVLCRRRRPDLASRTLSKWRHVWPF